MQPIVFVFRHLLVSPHSLFICSSTFDFADQSPIIITFDVQLLLAAGYDTASAHAVVMLM